MMKRGQLLARPPNVRDVLYPAATLVAVTVAARDITFNDPIAGWHHVDMALMRLGQTRRILLMIRDWYERSGN